MRPLAGVRDASTHRRIASVTWRRRRSLPRVVATSAGICVPAVPCNRPRRAVRRAQCARRSACRLEDPGREKREGQTRAGSRGLRGAMNHDGRSSGEKCVVPATAQAWNASEQSAQKRRRRGGRHIPRKGEAAIHCECTGRSAAGRWTNAGSEPTSSSRPRRRASLRLATGTRCDLPGCVQCALDPRIDNCAASHVARRSSTCRPGSEHRDYIPGLLSSRQIASHAVGVQ